MANLFESSINRDNFEKLHRLKEEILSEKEKENELFRIQMEERYKQTHIFKTYEEAIDWMVNNPGVYITWHASSIAYDSDKNSFRAYEQEYSYDGVMCWDVVNRYTRDGLLKKINDHKEWLADKYPEEKGNQWWLDEYGTLKYVNL